VVLEGFWDYLIVGESPESIIPHNPRSDSRGDFARNLDYDEGLWQGL
jgi:hypothetical protein